MTKFTVKQIYLIESTRCKKNKKEQMSDKLNTESLESPKKKCREGFQY